MMWKIPLFDLDYGQEEENAVLSVLRSRWLTMGEVTQRFEQAFAEHLGVKHAFAVSNGTVALHLACAAAGIQLGDEVIVPALTFVATAAAARYVGAEAVFADSQSPTNLCIAPQSIAQKITPRTRAVMVMHYAGYMCDMPAIQKIAADHGLLVLEDAAHAPGASLEGTAAGSWGTAAGFSFFSNKNLATGEGGMVTTNDDAVAEKVRQLRSHGMTSLSWDRYKGQAMSYDVTMLGYNYRPTEISSALGLVQLGKLERNNARRRELTGLYHRLLAEHTPEVTLPFLLPRGTPTAHILPVILPAQVDRAAVMNAMKARGIQTSIHYPLIPHFSAYRAQNAPVDDLPVALLAAQHELTLPLYALMADADVHTVVEALRQSLDEAGASA
jgi:dTDP-4-amino-4,6-dideoxygalactose transaminase